MNISGIAAQPTVLTLRPVQHQAPQNVLSDRDHDGDVDSASGPDHDGGAQKRLNIFA